MSSFIVDIFRDDASIHNAAVKQHRGEPLAEVMAGNKRPQDPVHHHGCHDSHRNCTSSGRGHGDW